VTTNLGPAAAPDDSALINLVLNGHSECFAVLMDRHAAMVKRRIRGMTRSFSDADDIMQEAVERLPAKDEQVVVLHDLQELSLQETAQELQTTIPAVKARVFRAKAALSKTLLREFRELGSQGTLARKIHSPQLAA
jgi:DNA-directed RNA polymerase specialized sigma24 family protein